MELTGRAITGGARLLHKSDPRCLIVTGLLFTVSMVVSDNRPLILAVILVCFALLTPNIRLVLMRLVPVNFFMIFLWITLPFTAEDGVSQALTYTLRVNAAAMIFMATIAPMGVYIAGNAMMRMKVPHKLVAVLLLSYRYIFILWEHISTSIRAMSLRKPDNMGVLTQWKSYASIIAATIAEAIRRADRVQQAMLCRGFDGRFPVTRDFRWRLRDTICILLSLLLSATFICAGNI